MAKVSDLARYALSQNPQDSASRMCVYNYFKNRLDLDLRLTPSLVLEFFSCALIFNHWQTHREELAQETISLLVGLAQEVQLDFDIKEIPNLKNIQVVGIEDEQNLFDIVTKSTEKIIQPTQKFRVMSDEDRGMVALILNEDNSLVAKSYGKFVFIQNGELWPVHPLQQLQYDANLEIALGVSQIVEISPYNFGKFCRTNAGLKGIITKGYSFQKSEIIDVLALNQVPGLFFSIKKMERFFINRSSEPVYREIMSALENSISLLQAPTPETIALSTESYQKAQHIYQHIFPDDKMLFLLLRDLSRTLLGLKVKAEADASVAAPPVTRKWEQQKRDEECRDLIPLL